MKISRERLEAMQRRAGLTGEALAARAGITPPMLSRLKSRGSCSPTTGRKLATVLGSYDFVVHDRPSVTPFTLPTLEECWADMAKAGLLRTDSVPLTNPYEAAREEREAENTLQVIREFLDRPVPVSWNRWPIKNRRLFWMGRENSTVTDYNLLSKATVPKRSVTTVQRDRVCAAEIWVEAFHHPLESMTNKSARNINRIVSTLPGWRETEGSIRFGPYGKCRGFVRSI